jgi:hypothetical protein
MEHIRTIAAGSARRANMALTEDMQVCICSSTPTCQTDTAPRLLAAPAHLQRTVRAPLMRPPKAGRSSGTEGGDGGMQPHHATEWHNERTPVKLAYRTPQQTTPSAMAAGTAACSRTTRGSVQYSGTIRIEAAPSGRKRSSTSAVARYALQRNARCCGQEVLLEDAACPQS